MNNEQFVNSPAYIRLLFAGFVIITIFLLFLFIGLAIAIPIFNIELNSLSKLFTPDTPDGIAFLKYMQIVQSFGLFIVPPFIIAWFFSRQSFAYLKLDSSPKRISWSLAICILVMAIPTINLLVLLNSHLDLPPFLSGLENWMKESENNAQKITEAFLKVNSVGGLLFNIFLIGVLPAIGEELLFRGVIQRLFTEMTRNVHWGIFLAAFLFSALHFQFYGLIPRMLLGMLFGYLFVWSRTIWVPIIAHFTNNAIAVIFYYLNSSKIVEHNIDHLGTTNQNFYISILSAAGTIYLIWYFYKKHQERKIVAVG